MRGTTPARTAKVGFVVVSIHVSRAGDDFPITYILSDLFSISIHVPRAGDDSKSCLKLGHSFVQLLRKPARGPGGLGESEPVLQGKAGKKRCEGTWEKGNTCPSHRAVRPAAAHSVGKQVLSGVHAGRCETVSQCLTDGQIICLSLAHDRAVCALTSSGTWMGRTRGVQIISTSSG